MSKRRTELVLKLVRDTRRMGSPDPLNSNHRHRDEPEDPRSGQADEFPDDPTSG